MKKVRSRVSIEAQAKVAYEYHQKAKASGTEIWAWDDLPFETRQHWKNLIGAVTDFVTENRKKASV